ncbi:MAG: hypothetical protein K0S32_3208 [Bacteroidetes bacterium]|jgi:hypothetical protein|nr:hypothetical protein [Bacteroidota bacterium]
MKLSHITLGVLLVSATAGKAQDDKSKTKGDTLKNKHKIKPLTKARTTEKDSSTIIIRNSPEEGKKWTCGPCGMG